MKIWIVQQTCTDECTYHYDVPLAYFTSKTKAELFLKKTIKELSSFENKENYGIREVNVEE